MNLLNVTSIEELGTQVAALTTTGVALLTCTTLASLRVESLTFANLSTSAISYLTVQKHDSALNTTAIIGLSWPVSVGSTLVAVTKEDPIVLNNTDRLEVALVTGSVSCVASYLRKT